MMNRFHFVQFILIIFFVSCVDRFVIPSDIDSKDPGQFGAGDTTFLQISPLWDSSFGLVQPEDISIAQDGRVFVADKGNNSILVFDQNGNRPIGFESLSNLMDGDNNEISPIDVDVDKKMNVFFIDGSQRIFIWNQYWNDVPIYKVSSSGTFIHTQTNVDTTVLAGTDIWLSLLNDNEWNLTSVDMVQNESIIDSLTGPHLFYDGSEEMNVYLDNFYQADSSKFTALTAPAGDENMIFVTDNYGGNNNQYRILQIQFHRSLLLELSGGEYVWAFTGRFGSTVKGFGTGAGTVNQPLSIDVDYQGNLYYTQVGNYFPVHMIYPNLSGDFAVYTSGFQPEADDIMDPSWFTNAVDIALDDNKNIYVVDDINSDVTVFNSYGDYFKKAGYEQDSIKVMSEPCAAAVDQRGVLYVCDRESSSIYRYQLSNNLDEDITPED